MVIKPEFWSGKKVFLTGHTGFKGSWLAFWLDKLGARVTGYSLEPPTQPNLFTAANIKDLITDLRGDIRDRVTLKQAIDETEPDIVFHMAAQSLVRTSYRLPEETFSTNVMGTLNVLDLLKDKEKVQAIVVVTTDKCYKNQEWIWPYRENEPLGGHDPYSASKACTEILTESYRNSYQKELNGLASARAGNVIGGGDWSEDRLIPDLIRGFVSKEQVVIRSPHAIRPWQHVLDALSGYLILAQNIYESENNSFNQAWNFGPDTYNEVSVGEVADKLVECWGDDAAYKIINNENQLHEANFLKLDSTKARSFLNWCPVWKLEESLIKTVDWYKAYYTNESNIPDIMTGQIESHQKHSK